MDAKLVARVQAAAKELGYLPDPAAGTCPIRGKVRS
jgi:DNA-binding LacI/PurR family transcriptional regulator